MTMSQKQRLSDEADEFTQQCTGNLFKAVGLSIQVLVNTLNNQNRSVIQVYPIADGKIAH